MKKSVLVLSIMAALAGCNEDSSSTNSYSTQASSSEVVTQEQADSNNEEALRRHSARIVGEKEGSLYLVKGEGLYGKTDGKYVWTYESQIPSYLTLDRVDFDVDADFTAAIEYQVNIYLMIDGVEHKADIMVNRKDKSEEANVVFFIDDVENKEEFGHHWIFAGEKYDWLEEVGAEKNTHGVSGSSFASFDAFKAAMKKAQDLGYIGEVVVENQEHRYDDVYGNQEQIQGNFFLKFGDHNYTGDNDTFVIRKWELLIDGVNVADPDFNEPTPVDPEFGQDLPEVDPEFGQELPVDPGFGQDKPAVDPDFGQELPVDPGFGQDKPEVDADFGQELPVDPGFGQDKPEVDADFGQELPVDPPFGQEAPKA